MGPNPRHQELLAYAATGPKKEKWDALAELRTIGESAAPAILEGLSHPDWRVRRASAIFVDHEPVPELIERLRLALYDPKAKVRMWAVHSLACEPCKPGGNPLDPVPPIVRRLHEDKAVRVRRMAMNMLIQRPPERRITRAVRQALAVEQDARIQRAGRWWLKRHSLAGPARGS